MKEASGELSMTAVAVVAIAAVGVLFTTLIWPQIKKSLVHNQNCTNAYGCTGCNGSTCSCIYAETNSEGVETTHAVTCDDPSKETAK